MHRTVMRLEWQRGNLYAARQQFELCRVPAEELGVAPLPETEQLAAAVENALTAPRGSPGLRRLPPELLRPPLLVGREAAWERLERAWERRQAVYVSGPAGVGKTRLLLDFVQHKTKGNFSLVRGRLGDKSVPLSTLARAWRLYFATHPAAPDALEAWVGTFWGRLSRGSSVRTSARGTTVSSSGWKPTRGRLPILFTCSASLASPSSSSWSKSKGKPARAHVSTSARNAPVLRCSRTNL